MSKSGVVEFEMSEKKQKTLNCKYPTVNESLVGKDRHENLNETACNGGKWSCKYL